jgi:hypothetical protein
MVYSYHDSRFLSRSLLLLRDDMIALMLGKKRDNSWNTFIGVVALFLVLAIESSFRRNAVEEKSQLVYSCHY